MPPAAATDAIDIPAARKRPRAWRRTAAAWLGVLAAYWLALFVGTHIPAPTLAKPLFEYDKAMHGCAYALLATLMLIAWRRTGAKTGLGARLAVAALVLGYGAVDELTQPYFHRACDFYDWLCDATGVAFAIAVDTWRHRRR